MGECEWERTWGKSLMTRDATVETKLTKEERAYLRWLKSRGPGLDLMPHFFRAAGLAPLLVPMLALGWITPHPNWRCSRRPGCLWLKKRAEIAEIPRKTAHYMITEAGKARFRPHLVLEKLRDAHKAQR